MRCIQGRPSSFVCASERDALLQLALACVDRKLPEANWALNEAGEAGQTFFAEAGLVQFWIQQQAHAGRKTKRK